MKSAQIIAILSTLCLTVGCNRNSETDTSSSGASASRQDRDSTVLTPTSRGDETNRKYAGDTNDLIVTTAKPADNTGRNVRDRSDATLTPGDQGNSESDRELTRRVRRALSENDQLSTMAKNIKIITIDGKVTLRGPVKNDQELKTITEAAQNVAGGAPIDNQLEVKTTNQ